MMLRSIHDKFTKPTDMKWLMLNMAENALVHKESSKQLNKLCALQAENIENLVARVNKLEIEVNLLKEEKIVKNESKPSENTRSMEEEFNELKKAGRAVEDDLKCKLKTLEDEHSRLELHHKQVEDELKKDIKKKEGEIVQLKNQEPKPEHIRVLKSKLIELEEAFKVSQECFQKMQNQYHTSQEDPTFYDNYAKVQQESSNLFWKVQNARGDFQNAENKFCNDNTGEFKKKEEYQIWKQNIDQQRLELLNMQAELKNTSEEHSYMRAYCQGRIASRRKEVVERGNSNKQAYGNRLERVTDLNSVHNQRSGCG